MDSIPNGRVRVYGGGLGIVVKGQKLGIKAPPPPNRQKGDIKSFSQASARRLRETLALAKPVDREQVPWGVTLTIPGDILTDDQVRALWHDFQTHYLRRRFYSNPFVWRIELQKRKQAHWHIVMWARPIQSGVLYSLTCDELARRWRECVLKHIAPLEERTAFGFDQHGVKVQALSAASATGIIGYLCDHASKHKQEQLGWKGRQWGVVNRHALDLKGTLLAEEEDEVHLLAARQYRRLQERLRARGGAYTGVYVSPLGTVNKAVFGRDEKRLLQCYALARRIWADRLEEGRRDDDR